MFGSNVNHDQDSQDNVQESRTDGEDHLNRALSNCRYPARVLGKDEHHGQQQKQEQKDIQYHQ